MRTAAANDMGGSDTDCGPLPYWTAEQTEVVLRTLGDRCHDPVVARITWVIYGTILISGLAGNVFTVVVIGTNRFLHTATNFYLLSLALSDTITLIGGLPAELYVSTTGWYPYPLPEFTCQLRCYLTELTSYASVLTITAFSVERWLAICMPFKMRPFSALSRAVGLIVAIWMVSALSAAPMLHFVKLNKVLVPRNTSADNGNLSDSGDGNGSGFVPLDGTEYCTMVYGSRNTHVLVIATATLVFFVFPFGLLTFVYGHIMCKLTTRDRSFRGQWNNDSVQYDGCNQHGDCVKRSLSARSTSESVYRNNRPLIRMLVVVVMAFFICWLPFHAQRLVLVCSENQLDKLPDNIKFLLQLMWFISGYFYYANSCVNPLIYSLLSHNFRTGAGRTTRALKSVITGRPSAGDRVHSDAGGGSIGVRSERPLDARPSAPASEPASCGPKVVATFVDGDDTRSV